jgi:predicted nucleic acid-binding protein
MNCAGRGLMLVIDAGALFEVVVQSPRGERIRTRLERERDQAAPHVIDVEVLGIIRGRWLRGLLDGTAASLAIDELHDWPAQRFGHGFFLARAWELRDNVRTWDAMYVALAEALGATLLTTDQRLARVPGLGCRVEALGA